MKFLLAHGADPTIADNNGNTPSVIAEKHIKKLLVDGKLLIEEDVMYS